MISRRSVLPVFAAGTSLIAMSDAKRKMTIHLVPGSIGVQLTQQEAVDAARQYGFESVAPDGVYLATLEPARIDALTAEVRAKGLVWGNAGLPVEFRKDPQAFEADLAKLPAVAKALQRAGVTRMGTWIGPSHASLTYLANFQQHTERLRKVTAVLGAHGIRLGLEYVGPKTLWTSNRYPFIHTMAECRELIAAVGREQCGLLLDSWHWYTAGETAADIASLKNEDIVCGDLNDAPAGIPVAEQIDSKRELPMATGVIPVGEFLNALQKIGFDGPIRCEPFNAALRAMPKEQALAAVSKSMHEAFALIR